MEEVERPAHYTSHPSGLEARHLLKYMSWNLGTAFKYLFREGLKGPRLLDLKKAEQYLLFAKEDRDLTAAYVPFNASAEVMDDRWVKFQKRILFVLLASPDTVLRRCLLAMTFRTSTPETDEVGDLRGGPNRNPIDAMLAIVGQEIERLEQEGTP